MENLIVNLRPRALCHAEAHSDLYAFNRLNPHDRRGELTIELSVPRHMTTKTGRTAGRDNLNDSAERVAALPCLIDRSYDSGFGGSIGYANRRVFGNPLNIRIVRRRREVDVNASQHRDM